MIVGDIDVDIKVNSNHKMLFGEKSGFKVGRELRGKSLAESLWSPEKGGR